MEKNIKKIVEIGIDIDEMDEELFEDMGVDTISLVENPAIEVDFLAFSEAFFVDNSDFMHFKEFLDANQDLMKKPFGGAAGNGGVNHAEQLKQLKEKGVNTEYPFGYCFQIAQFVFYALGGYESQWDLKCIKKMDFEVEGVEFEATHWYVQHKETNQIVDLSAEQFDGLLDIQEWYPRGVRANLGFPYYNVEEKRVEFDETVPSLQTLKLYNKWKEDHGELEGIEKYYQASRYEEVRLSEQEFVEPNAGESEDEFIGRCMSSLEGEFPDQDQRLAVCYSYWEGEKMEECEYATEEEQDKILEYARENGEVITEEDVVLKFNENAFATIGEVLNGIRALDILGTLRVKRDQKPETFYRYQGPPAQRKFCRAMQNLNKIYKKKDIQRMANINRSFGHDGQPYSKWSYKGGPNCKHYWEEIAVFKNDEGRKVIIVRGPASGNAGKTNNARSQSSAGAVSNNAYFSKTLNLSFNDDQMVVTGPVMIPNKMIVRRDEMGEPYYVYFTRKTIRKMAEKFLKQNKHHNTDINHDHNVTTQNTLLESWISEDMTHDKAYKMGFALPKGTWYASYKINDEQTWKDIKAGKIKGFSLAGNFLERLNNKASAHRQMQQIIEILENIDETGNDS